MQKKVYKSQKISPTAHYTGFIWYKNGLSDDLLYTKQGLWLYKLLQPLMNYSKRNGGPVVEEFLLARHLLIDHLLEKEINEGRVSLVIEIAAGLSPRGLRFSKKYKSQITYIEADLEGMIERKRKAIGDSIDTKYHQLVEIDALAETGPKSLKNLIEQFSKEKGVAIVTEGLVNYFDEENVKGIWTRFANAISVFPHGIYISDIHLARENTGKVANLFSKLLALFVRGKVYLHFNRREEAEKVLLACGFKTAKLHKPVAWTDKIYECGLKGANLVRIIEART